MTDQELKDLLPPQDRKLIGQSFQIYNSASKLMKMKLEIWSSEFKTNSYHNPIHHIEARIKSPESIVEKLHRLDVPFTLASMEENVLDLAGVRVVCRYIDDVYHIAELIKGSDMEIIKSSDYIKNPKPNGYRSYHIVLRVPVPLSCTNPQVPVEVQIRTIAMDTWASLEHEILYKVSANEREAKVAYLKECAEELAHIDYKMQFLFQMGRVYSPETEGPEKPLLVTPLIS